jgi:tetratricopeptide (TPR) repeat protein
MKSFALNADLRRSPGWRFLIVFLAGVPIVSAAILMAQADLATQFAIFRHQTFNSLTEPDRYRYDESLLSERSPTSMLTKEMAFYQEKVKTPAGGALDQATLASIYLGMARATGEASWYLLAEQTAQQSLAILPIDNSEAISVLARVTEARHDFVGALRLANQSKKEQDALSIQVTSNLAMGKLKLARQAADRLVDDTLSLSSFTLLAMVQTAQGQDQAALQSFRQALEVEEAGDFSSSARTRTLLGRFYYERGQLDRAEAFYQEALYIQPAFPQALLNLAQLKIRQGDRAAAEDYYRQFTDQTQGSPTIYDALVLKGRARIKQGDRQAVNQLQQEAEMRLRQSLPTDKTAADSFGHRRDLARLLLERGRSPDAPEALRLMQAEVQRRRDAETLDTYAWALLQTGQPQAAEAIIQEAIALGTHNAGIFDRASAIETALGHADAANLYRQQGQAIDPQFGDRARLAIGLGAGLSY